MNDNFQEDNTTVQQDVENSLVGNIISGETTDYRVPYTFPQPQTEEEITDTVRQDNINFLEGELAKNARDFEIAAEIEAQKKADLLRNIIDPGLGLITNEGVSSLDAIRNDNGDSVIPHLDPIALQGMEQLLDNLRNTIELSSDEEDKNNDVKPPPEAFYPPMIDLTEPNLQDILTNHNQNSDTLNEIRVIRDTINTEVREISSPPPPDEFPGDFDDTEFDPPQPPYNPFGSATAPPLPNEDHPPYPSAPPYPDNPPDYDGTLPLDYDELFPPQPVPIRQIPVLSTDEESSDDKNPPPPPPDPILIYTLVLPEVDVDDVNDPGNLIGNPNVNVILPPLQGDPNFPPIGDPNWDSNPYYTDEESVEDPGYNDDDIDFVVTPITTDENTTTGSLLYRDRRNELYRRNARRRALNILAKKRQRKVAAAKGRKNPKNKITIKLIMIKL